MDQTHSSCIPFLHVMEDLKYKKPNCWESLGIHSFESASDHMWQTWAILMAYSQEDDSPSDRCMLMSLFHAITDFTVTGGEPRKEYLAKDYLRCLLQAADPMLAQEFDDLWSEYKMGETRAAKRVRDACACAYALQDGKLDEIGRTTEEISKLRGVLSSQDLSSFMDLLQDEIEARNETESAKMIRAITVGKAYWDAPSESFDLVSKAMKTIHITSALTFLRLTQRLAKTDRAGWVKCGISSSNVEKVSSHSWRMAIFCWVLVARQGKLNRIDCISMACTHDIGEIVIADVTPHDGISKVDKKAHERHSQMFLVHTLEAPNPFAARSLQKYLTIFEAGETPEAQLVHDIDSIECRTQAVEYARRYPKIAAIEKHFLARKPKVHSPDLQEFTILLSQELATSLKRREDIYVIFVIGGPGVGKGTQCKLLAREHSFHHISVGELLDAPSPFAQFITDSKREYVIIPANLTVSLLETEMSRAISGGKTVFLIDGFPRSVDQARRFDEMVYEHYSTILLDCSEQAMLDRLTSRAEAGAKAGVERVDDNPDTIAKRMNNFRKNNLPVETHLKQHGTSFKIVPCDGSADEVLSLFQPAVLEMMNGKEA